MMIFVESTEAADNITRMTIMSKSHEACLKLAWKYFLKHHTKGIPQEIAI